jgi:asparagine synthase (glutamine-hydrolysing)
MAAELDEVLKEAVRLRLVGDVPLGAFLSGGLDSSLIAAYMRESCEKTVRTFSIGFGDPSYDETLHARAVARHLGLNHEVHRVEPGGRELLNALPARFGEPFGDSSAIPTWHLSRFARENVTVALSGDGGDEIFGGYRRYGGRRLLRYYLRLPRLLRTGLVETYLMMTKESTGYTFTDIRKMLRYFNDMAGRVARDPRDLAPAIFSSEEVRGLLEDECVDTTESDPVYQRALRFTALPPEGQMMLLDQETYLGDDINVKVDRMSMAHSLEVRSPLLDHKVVEFMAGVPLEMKLKGLTGKYLLKKVAERRLPRSIVRRRKQGFSVPLGRWFKGELASVWHEVMNAQSVREGPLQRGTVEELWSRHQNGVQDNGVLLWHILIFQMWFAGQHTRQA